MMSILPKLSIAVWTSLSGASPCVRSPLKTAVSPAISLAACSATSPSRSLMSTLAPCDDSSSAVARPMPRADPVTIATLSSSTPMYLSPSVTNGRREPYVSRRPIAVRSASMSAADELEAIAEDLRTHLPCGFEPCETCTNFVPGEGNPEALVMVVGEAPGASEDKQGRPFVGRSGKLLDQVLAAAGLPRETVFIANVVKARPPGNRDP